jgi:hypothetical protein
VYQLTSLALERQRNEESLRMSRNHLGIIFHLFFRVGFLFFRALNGGADEKIDWIVNQFNIISNEAPAE